MHWSYIFLPLTHRYVHIESDPCHIWLPLDDVCVHKKPMPPFLCYFQSMLFRIRPAWNTVIAMIYEVQSSDVLGLCNDFSQWKMLCIFSSCMTSLSHWSHVNCLIGTRIENRTPLVVLFIQLHAMYSFQICKTRIEHFVSILQKLTML